MTQNTFNTINLSQAYLNIPDDSFAAQLRLAANEDWQAAVHHCFTEELFAGSLSDRVLARYLVQDYQFFDAFLAMIGACVAYTDSSSARLRFCSQLGMLTSDENVYFQETFAELGLSPADISSPKLTQTTQDFLESMWHAVDSQSYAELLILLTIAEWLYLDWGELDLPLPSEKKHLDWIDLHRGKDFQAWVQFLIDELNRIAPELSSEEIFHLTTLWKQVVKLERNFFDAAYL